MSEDAAITVRVLKYDGTEYRRWKARVSREEESLIVLDAEFEFDVEHSVIGSIKQATRTREFYWVDRWYNVFRFLNSDGETRLFYCNINSPPVLADRILTYVDLDIDVLVQPDLSYRVLDRDEFEVNAARYGYSDEVRTKVREALAELIEMIQSQQFPFEAFALPAAVV